MRQGGLAMLPVAEVQECFDTLSSGRPAPPSLTFEAFLAALIWLADRLRPHTVPFLSEGLRTYVIRYVGRAKKVSAKAGGSKAAYQSVYVAPRRQSTHSKRKK